MPKKKGKKTLRKTAIFLTKTKKKEAKQQHCMEFTKPD